MTTLTTLQSQYQAATAALHRRQGEASRLTASRTAALEGLTTAKETADTCERVALLLQQTAQEARDIARGRIEGLVTQALQAVFGAEYRFAIELTERGGRPEAEFYVVSPDFETGALMQTRPQDSRGGGVVDIVSLALREAMLETYRPRLEGPVILDEPAKMVSADYIGPTAEFLAAVTKAYERQVLLVTHQEALAATADRTFRVEIREGQSVVQEVG